jgi:ankyrin repeat protein
LLEHPRVDPSARDNDAIRRAAINGRLQVVERLLGHPRVDPSAWDNYAIRWAARKGHLQVVERLLGHPNVNPSAIDNCAILLAASNGHVQVVNLLLDHPRMNWTTVDWSHLSGLPNASEIKEIFVLRRREYAKKRRALRTIVRHLYEKFGTAENLRHHIWKPGGYLSRTLAARYG